MKSFIVVAIKVIKPRKLERSGNVVHVKGKRNSYRILVGESEGQNPLEKPRHRWEYNVKMILKKIG